MKELTYKCLAKDCYQELPYEYLVCSITCGCYAGIMSVRAAFVEPTDEKIEELKKGRTPYTKEMADERTRIYKDRERWGS